MWANEKEKEIGNEVGRKIAKKKWLLPTVIQLYTGKETL